MINLEDIEKIETEIRELKSKTDEMDTKLQDFENLLKLLKKLKPDPLVKEIVFNIRNDEKLFLEFVDFLVRDKGKRNMILAITRKNLLDGCKDIKF